ncbi:zeta toxin family protein [Nocardia rhamnosiphila]|uniref:UDP-N-acetylglucosamine kinase n=1 Tax=Nocardia rhamnosiphila TaxID=426716 RepID=A0ABV2WWM3_9NOCA
MIPEHDESLYYECAAEIAISLMAQCSAVQSIAEYVGDSAVQGQMKYLRRAYLAELSRLDPGDAACVRQQIRSWGSVLTGKVEAPRPYGAERRPAVDYRLERDEHARIFRDSIAVEICGNSSESAAPAAVIVMGAPGAGKTTVRQRLLAEWSRELPIVIDPELYLAYHPNSWDLVLADDDAAREVLMADALGWVAMALDVAVTGRRNVLLEVGAESTDPAAGFAKMFHDNGYRVSIEFTTAPEAERLMHLGMRYQARHGNWGALAVE